MKSVIKRDHVQLAEAAAAPRKPDARAAAASSCAAPRVRLLPGDGDAQLLELTCSCGEVSLIEVQCEKKP
jgi:hypothetical protein